MASASPRTAAKRARGDDIHARLAHLERTVETHARELAIQLERIAQLQADIDTVRGAWIKVKPPPLLPRLLGP
jgi:hypothetical protein